VVSYVFVTISRPLYVFNPFKNSTRVVVKLIRGRGIPAESWLPKYKLHQFSWWLCKFILGGSRRQTSRKLGPLNCAAADRKVQNDNYRGARINVMPGRLSSLIFFPPSLRQHALSRCALRSTRRRLIRPSNNKMKRNPCNCILARSIFSSRG
jgi:hypothetical protein